MPLQGNERRREGVERKKKRKKRRETEIRRERALPLLAQEAQEQLGKEVPVVTSPISPSKKAACLRAMSNLKLGFKLNA